MYDEIENQGVGFVGLNDPYAEDLTEDDYFASQTCVSKLDGFMKRLKTQTLKKKGTLLAVEFKI